MPSGIPASDEDTRGLDPCVTLENGRDALLPEALVAPITTEPVLSVFLSKVCSCGTLHSHGNQYIECSDFFRHGPILPREAGPHNRVSSPPRCASVSVPGSEEQS